MYRTDLFKQENNPLKYTIPYARIIPFEYYGRDIPIVINKDGSIQTTWSYCGPDLGATVPDELALLTQQLNNVFMEIESGFVIYFEAQRHQSAAYRTDVFFPPEDNLSPLIDEERKLFFSTGNHYESNYFCTLYCTPKSDIEDRMQEMVVEGRQHREAIIDEAVVKFLQITTKIITLFNQLGVPSNYLDMDEMISYLHSTVSDNNRPIKFPKRPMLLDQILYDSPLYGGLTPRLGSKHMRIVTPIKYAASTAFGFFDVLNQLNFPYRWISRFYCLSKMDSLSEVSDVKTKWSGKIKSFMTMLKETLRGETTDRDDNVNAVMKTNEAADALTAIENDTVSYGFYSSMIIILDDNAEVVEEKANTIINALLQMGITAKSEGLNAVDAWMGSIPGNVGHFIRRPLVSTGNLVHMIPLSNIWSGDEYCKQLNGPSLLYTQTTGNTPFRFNLHVGNVGHSMLVGKTGGGKSVHLNLIEAQFRKYQNAKIFVFDKGSSSIALTLGVGGRFYDLGSGEKNDVSFQPLAHTDRPGEKEWLLGWLTDFMESNNVKVTPAMSKKIYSAINTVAAYKDVKLRRMTTLVNAINDNDIKVALTPLTVGGAYKMFDSPEESLSFSNWQTFEMEKIMQTKQIVGTMLMYIFHRIEQALDGSPTLIVLDECWVFFENEQFAHKITEWLRVLRKYNASVLFATQEMETIVKSPIFDSVNTNCDVKIFLPDHRSITESVLETYEKLGINSKQVNIIHTARLKHDYYYSSSRGARLYELALEQCPLTLAYVAVGKKDVDTAKGFLRDYPQEDFNKHWLAYKRLAIPKEEGA